MHRLLKVSICLTLLLIGVQWFFVATQASAQYPLHSTAIIDISEAPKQNDNGQRLITASEKTAAPIGRIRYSSTPTGPVQTIALSPAAAKQTPALHNERAFGFTLAVTTTTFATTDEVVGRWVSFGSESQTAALVKRLSDEGFTTELKSTSAGVYVRSFFLGGDIATTLIELAAFLTVFVAGLVSAAKNTRIRAVQQVFGRSTTRTVATEAGRSLGFIGAVTTVVLVLWGLISKVGWGGSETFSGAGLLVVFPVIISAVVCAIACVVAPLVSAVVVNRIPEQIAGKRPVRFIQVASTFALIIVMLGTFIGIDQTVTANHKLQAAISSQQLWHDEPHARTFSLASTTDEVADDLTPGWTRAMRTIAKDHGLLLSDLDTSCGLRADLGPCLFVNKAYLERTTLTTSSGKKLTPGSASVELYIPAALKGESVSIRAELNRQVKFNNEFLAEEDTGSAAAVAVTEVFLLAPHQIFPIFSGKYGGDNDLDQDPVLVVLDDTNYPGIQLIAAASTGKLIFFAPDDTLARILDENGASALVFSIDHPAEEAAGTAIEARAEMVNNVTVLVTCLVLSFALLVVLTAGYLARQRKQLFLSYLHGIPFWRRHGLYLAFLLCIVATSVLLSIAVGLDLDVGWIVGRTLIGLAFIAAIVPFLRTSERQFSAGFLKHP